MELAGSCWAWTPTICLVSQRKRLYIRKKGLERQDHEVKKKKTTTTVGIRREMSHDFFRDFKITIIIQEWFSELHCLEFQAPIFYFFFFYLFTSGLLLLYSVQSRAGKLNVINELQYPLMGDYCGSENISNFLSITWVSCHLKVMHLK